MRKVWKYEIPAVDEFQLELPGAHKPLYVAIQNGVPCLWVLVEPDAPIVSRGFRLAGTGHEINGFADYVGSFQLRGGALVFHLFAL